MGRLDHQPLFGKGARAPPRREGRGTQTRHERATEIEPSAWVERYNVGWLLKVCCISAGQSSLLQVHSSLYLGRAGLAGRGVVHLQKIILRCVGFCFCILHFICKAD